MSKDQTLVQHLADLAKEVSKADFFEFPHGVDKDETYHRVAESVLEFYLMSDSKHRDEVLLASNIHLLVENTVLNYKLMLIGDE